jgi:hypothetical protein
MTTSRSPLSDALLRTALLELADGPGAGRLTDDVLRTVSGMRQAHGFALPSLRERPRLALAVVALLLLATAATLLAVGAFNQLRPRPPLGPMSIVVQQWNGLAAPDSIVSHTAYAPGSLVGVEMRGLPRNVVGVRWSVDGARVVYFETEVVVRTGPRGPQVEMTATQPFLAGGDGSGAVPIPIARPFDSYFSYAWDAGPLWAPDGGHFALPWNSHSCEGIDCVPLGGIDIFDRDGRPTLALETPGNVSQSAFWSGNGLAILWTTGACVDGSCINDAVHWRPIAGDPTVTTFPGVMTGFVWPGDGRIRAIQFDVDGATGIVTMAPDGSQVQTIAWDSPSRGGVWSPDGRWLADVDDAGARVLIYEVGTGREAAIPIPRDSYVAAWAPDGRSIALVGPAPDESTGGNAFHVLTIEDGRLTTAGVGTDFTWVPASALP